MPRRPNDYDRFSEGPSMDGVDIYPNDEPDDRDARMEELQDEENDQWTPERQ